MKNFKSWLSKSIYVLAIAAMHSQASLITYSEYFNNQAYSNTGRVHEPTTTLGSNTVDISLPGFDNALGTLTKVSFSYSLSTVLMSNLRVYDPSYGLHREENVHGKGFATFAYSLKAKNNFPTNFTGIREKTGDDNDEYQLECNQDSNFYDDIGDPSSGQCSVGVGSRRYFSDTIDYIAINDLDQFLNGPLELSSYNVLGSVVTFCDDEEDWCQIISEIRTSGNLSVSYEYSALTDTPSSPITNVPEPSTIAIFSLGLLGIFNRQKRMK